MALFQRSGKIPHIPFMRFARAFFLASGLLVLASIGAVATVGLNFGIDFQGGTMIEIGFEEPADLGAVREVMGGLGLGEVQVQEFGNANDVLIRVAEQPGGDEAQQAVVTKVRAALGERFGEGVSYRRVEVVGPKVGDELVFDGVLAVVVAVIAMLFYIWLRFDTQFGVGAVASLTHDVILTLGIFSVFQMEFGLPIVAALLTILGYSINDTVVVYDRIRENLRKYKKMDLPELIDLSINETLSRTLVTSGTTLLALLALFYFGGPVIHNFVFAMIFGIVIGTYSSIFIASPTLKYLGVRRDWSGEGAGKATKGAGA